MGKDRPYILKSFDSWSPILLTLFRRQSRGNLLLSIDSRALLGTGAPV